MSAGNIYLAVFLGSPTSPQMTAWNALPQAERKAKERAGITAWTTWVEQHKGEIVEMGGPLGKTLRVATNGVHSTSNALSAFTIVRAESHEGAAKLFEKHPHFMLFPGEAVEVMPVMAIPPG
jgi:phosphoketolase